MIFLNNILFLLGAAGGLIGIGIYFIDKKYPLNVICLIPILLFIGYLEMVEVPEATAFGAVECSKLGLVSYSMHVGIPYDLVCVKRSEGTYEEVRFRWIEGNYLRVVK